MDYLLDGDAVAMREALVALLHGRMPNPATEPDSVARRDAWRELVASGWLEHFASALSAGSRPADAVTAMHVAEAFGAVPTCGPVDTVAGYLLPLATTTNWSQGLDALRSGEPVTGLVPTIVPDGGEAGIRRANRLHAVRDGAAVRITGTLEHVPCAGESRTVVVPIEIDGAPAIALVPLVEGSATVGLASGVDLCQPRATVTLTAAEASHVHTSGHLLAAEDLCARWHSLFLDAEAVGGGSEVLARTVAYCTRREQFGRPVGSFQAVRHRIADATIRIEGARSLAYRAAWDTIAQIPDAGVDVLASRVWAASAYVTASETAVQCHGGMGFTWEQRVHVFYRAALSARGLAQLAATRRVLASRLRAATTSAAGSVT